MSIKSDEMNSKNSHAMFAKQVICAGLLFLLTACQSKTSQPMPVSIILSASQDTTGVADEQNSGYQLMSKAADFGIAFPTPQADASQPQDVQTMVRSMAEKDKAVAIIGASSNDDTMRTAALVNFFNVPMLIPTANGDNLVPSNNLWAFRLSAPGAEYARYFFNQVANKSNINAMGLDPSTLEKFKIAILYEQNTFGESAAVATAESAMQQIIEINAAQSVYGMEIAVYGSFPGDKPDLERMNILVNQVKEQKVQMVYLVTSNPDVAVQLIQTFHKQYDVDETPMPVLLGQAGAFATREFVTQPEAKDVYILRQQWNKDRCPDTISSYYEGQAYAAAYLLNYTIQLVQETQPAPGWGLSPQKAADQLTDFRQQLREKLKETQLDVPCVGQVSFDNTGQNKELNFEIVSAQNGQESIISTANFLAILKKRLLSEEF